MADKPSSPVGELPGGSDRTAFGNADNKVADLKEDT
jgi:hypothetical protein